MQYTTHLGDDLANPSFKKGAAFVFKDQVVISGKENKVRIFPPSPRFPEINPTQLVYMVEPFQWPLDSLVSCTAKKLQLCVFQ